MKQTMAIAPPALSRRAFLQAIAALGAGLTLAIYDIDAFAQPTKGAASPAAPFAPNAFLRIAPDNSVTIIAKHTELGQGIYTGLAMLVADELDAAWSQVRVEGAPADAARYRNLFFEQEQGTGGSTGIANAFTQYREAGAAARAMLVAAAAERWKVPADSIGVNNGSLTHASGKKASFGELAAAAAKQSVPAAVKLKEAKDFAYIGKGATRVDAKAKATGTATYTLDVKLPDMLTALVAHPPRFGAKVKSFDPASVQGVPGVRYVVQVPNGVAVVATNFWSAKNGRDALAIQWDDASGFKYSSSDILAEFKRLAGTPGKVARNDGDASAALAKAAHTLDATYEFPYLAHAAMEPMNCVVRLDANRCEVWNGEQFQTGDQAAIAATVGLKPEQVDIHQLFAGGSFGRRWSHDSDYLVEAASIAKALAAQGKTGLPIKLVWTREDDMRAGYYRPANYHVLRAGLDADGNLVAWQHRLVGQSIVSGTPFEKWMKDGIDPLSVDGASDLRYAIPNVHVDVHAPSIGVPVLWWRSVALTHTIYSIETFVDELAAAAGKDPVVFRKALLAQRPQERAVLELAAERSGWSQPLAAAPDGAKRGRGIAVYRSSGSAIAQVAEVTARADNAFRVDRVVCAIDCGLAVNPDSVRAQIEGGIGFGLSAALHGAITIRNGAPEQSNFNDYRVLRIDEMPVVDVHIAASSGKPTGVGQEGVPGIAPAVANALAAATGKRLRKLPLALA